MGWLTASTTRYAAMSAVHAVGQFNLVPGETLIEIGPGTGEALLAMLEKQPRRLVAFELSSRLCSTLQDTSALQVPEVEIVCGDARNMSVVEDGSVDKVLGMDVVYFLDPLQDYMAELWRVLKPGGYIIFGFKEVSEAMDQRDAVNRHPDRIVEKLEQSGFVADFEETKIRKFGKRSHHGDYTTILAMKPKVDAEAPSDESPPQTITE